MLLNDLVLSHRLPDYQLTLKVPTTAAAEDKFCNVFLKFRKKGMIFYENCLPADDSHEISCLICYL